MNVEGKVMAVSQQAKVGYHIGMNRALRDNALSMARSDKAHWRTHWVGIARSYHRIMMGWFIYLNAEGGR